MKSSKALIGANVAGFVAIVVMNILSNVRPFNDQTMAEASARFPTLFTPAGFTFGIWGLIYLLLAAFVVYQALYFAKPTPGFLQRISWLFVLTCAANATWLLAFQYLQIELAMAIMVVLLGGLIAIYRRLDVGRAYVTAQERWLVHLPFSVYLGWISVATIANAAVLLTHWGWNGEPGSPQLWTVIAMITAAALALRALWVRGDIALASAIAWGLLGIYIQRRRDILLTNDYMVELGALACVIVIGVAIAVRVVKQLPASPRFV